MAQLKTLPFIKMPSKIKKDPIDWNKVNTVQKAVTETLETAIIHFQSHKPKSPINFDDMLLSVKNGLKDIKGSDPYVVMYNILDHLSDDEILLDWVETEQHYQTACGGCYSINSTDCFWRVQGPTIDRFYFNYQYALELYCERIARDNREAECIASFV